MRAWKYVLEYQVGRYRGLNRVWRKAGEVRNAFESRHQRVDMTSTETQSYRLLRAAAHTARKRRYPGSVNRGRLHQRVDKKSTETQCCRLLRAAARYDDEDPCIRCTQGNTRMRARSRSAVSDQLGSIRLSRKFVRNLGGVGKRENIRRNLGALC